MAVSFPSNPSIGATYSYGSRTWTYNGYAWILPLTGIIISSQYSTTSINTSTASLSFTYEYHGVTYTGGVCTITLPSAASPVDNGKFITIADEVGGISYENRGILVQGSGGQLINGQVSLLMKLERMSLTFIFRNNSWKTI